MEYRVERSKRRTLAIHITEAGEVLVKAPLRLPVREVERVLEQKEQWIQRATKTVAKRRSARLPFDLADGSRLLLMGRQIEVTGTDEAGVRLDGDRLLVPRGEAARRRAAVIAWYKQTAQQYLAGRVGHFAGVMGLQPARVRVGGAKTRWGSCSGRGSISFSFRLMTAPPEAVDYVVVHELAHLRQMNHSPQFYAVVQQTLPDYRSRAALLKEYQGRVAFEE